MKLKHVFLILCILGVALPYASYMPYFMEYGFDLRDFIAQAFADPISSFLSWDLVIAVLTMIVFIVAEGSKLDIKYFWLPILFIIFVGAAFGFPLFLYLRELKLEQQIK